MTKSMPIHKHSKFGENSSFNWWASFIFWSIFAFAMLCVLVLIVYPNLGEIISRFPDLVHLLFG